MKRLIWIPLLLFLLSLPCSAAGAEGVLSDLYHSLPDSITKELPDELAEEMEKEEAEAIASLDASFFMTFVGKSLSVALGQCAMPLLTLCGGVLLSAFLSRLSDGIGGECRRAFTFASGVALTLSCFEVIRPLWEELSVTLTGIGIVIKLALPAMTAIGAASGTISSAAVNAAWLTSLLTLLEQLCEAVLAPLLSFCLGLLLVSSVSRAVDSPSMSGVLRAIRQAFLLLLTLLATALTVVMAFQSVLAKGSDTVLLRSVKFASGSMIPIIGGAISEVAGSYLSGLSLIRSSAGTLTAVALVVSVLPLFLRLFLIRFGFSLVGAMAEILGADKEGATVKEASSLLDLSLGLLALCSVIFILVIGVFASSAVGV